MDIVFGSSVKEFVLLLEKASIAKVVRTLGLLEQYGPMLSLPHTKKISRSLFELRIHGDQNVRIIFVFYKGCIVLIHGFIKKTQKISKRDMKIALKKYTLLKLQDL